MRYTLLLSLIFLLFAGCKKDKFTTAPQITYKSINPNAAVSNVSCNFQVIPTLTIHITDAEGDLGLIVGKDTSLIYIRNLLTNKFDSVRLPDIQASVGKNFKADIDINLCNFLGASTRPRPKTDTLYFEIYVKDFAKNKSNVIRTTDPVFYITP